MPRKVARKAPEKEERRGSSFKTFMSCKPPVYKGGEDPLDCYRWITKMNQTFNSGDFTESQKVNYAVRMFEGVAMDWWDTLSCSLSTETLKLLTWDKLIEKLNTRFCSEGAVQRYEREFMNLKKGSMSISQYNTTFVEKLRFARNLRVTESVLVNRYVEGLPFPYRATVRIRTTLDAAMEEARRVEDDLHIRDAHLKTTEKGKGEASSGFHNKKGKFKNEDSKKETDFCKDCHSSHQGPCSKDTVRCSKCGKIGHYARDCEKVGKVCFNCGEAGHFANQCTKPKTGTAGNRIEIPKAKARAFNMMTDLEG